MPFIYLFDYCRGIHFLILNFWGYFTFATITPTWLLKFTSSELYPNYLTIACFFPIFFLVNTVSEPIISNYTGCHVAPVVTGCFPTPSQGVGGHPQWWQISSTYPFTHIPSLVPTNWIIISGSTLNHVNIMNVFTCGEEFSEYNKIKG